jgi:hypothetical protein
MNAASNLVGKLVAYIIDPAILIIFAAGFFMFVWGLVQFLWKLDEGGDNTTGKQHMIWGIVGMLIMVSVYGIITLINDTFDLDFNNPDVSSVNSATAPTIFQ